MELWKLLIILLFVSALGTFGVFAHLRATLIGRPFWLRQSHLRRGPLLPYTPRVCGDTASCSEAFYGGGFGVGFNGGFGDSIESNFGSIGVDDKKNNRVLSEAFYGHGGGHGGGGHMGGGHGGRGWAGPGGYGGPNQGTWRGWGGSGDSGDGWGWYGWSYPWAWYAPLKIAVTCYSDADCGEKGVCGNNGYCMTNPKDMPEVVY